MVFGAIGRLFGRFKQGLSRTRRALGDALRTLVGKSRKIDRDFLDELEDRLLTADIGLDKTEEILDRLQERFRMGEEASGEELLQFLKGELAAELDGGPEDGLNWQADGPTVILIVGVNGAGKTTTIAKLTKRFTDQGKSVCWQLVIPSVLRLVSSWPFGLTGWVLIVFGSIPVLMPPQLHLTR